MGNEIMKKVKEWLKENGFVGLVALAVAAVAFFLGWSALMWAAIGGFCGKNWEIIKRLWRESKLKDKVDDVVDDVKEKFQSRSHHSGETDRGTACHRYVSCLAFYTSFYKFLVFIINIAYTELTKQEIKDIVADEISNFVSKELESEVKSLLQKGKARDEVVDLMKKALSALYKYMWIRKEVWQNDIK